MNLNEKFNELETKLQQNHTTLGLKLDAIITALGAPPPTATTTLADVVTKLETIHDDALIMIQHLSRLVSAIAPLNYQIPSTEKVSMHYSLRMLVAAMHGTDQVTGTLPPPVLANLDYIRRLSELVVGVDEDAPRSILFYVYSILQSIGLPTGDATSTLLGLLSGIQNASLYDQQGAAPPANSLSTCGQLIVSTGVVEVGNRNYVRWPLLSNTDRRMAPADPTPNGTGLQPNPGLSWVGWRRWVQSSAPYHRGNATLGEAVPCNQWVTLSGDDDIIVAPNVEQGETIKVWLCGGAVSTDQVVNSVPYTETNGPGGHCIDWSMVQGFTGIYQMTGYETTLSVRGILDTAPASGFSMTRFRKGVYIFSYPRTYWPDSDNDTFVPLVLPGQPERSFSNSIVYSTAPFQLRITIL